MLPWRPLYSLFLDLGSHEVKLNLRVYPPDFDKALTVLVKRARAYFPPAAAEEIMAELRPDFCPHDPVMSRALSYCALFLPTLRVGLRAGEWVRVGEPPPWRTELTLFWSACYNSPAWEESLMSLLARWEPMSYSLV